MKAAICIYGFLGDPHNLIYLNHIPKLFSNYSNFDLFYSMPNMLTEYTDENVPIHQIEEQLNSYKFIERFFIKIKRYSHEKYIKDTISSRFPLINETHQIVIPRVLSMMDNINNTINLIQDNLKDYSLVIVTRLDYLPLIFKVTTDENYENKIMLWRKETPNISIEDRFFYGDANLISVLTNLYEYTLDINYYERNFYPERIIGFLLKNQIDNKKLLTQIDTFIGRKTYTFTFSNHAYNYNKIYNFFK